MANRHFGKLADVWKHLALAEILAIERPDHYAETHAGSAAYQLVDDPERDFGVRSFTATAATEPVLDRSRYRHWLRHLVGTDQARATYPGSALLAMLELGPDTSYLLCDLDPASVTSLERAADRLGLPEVSCVAADGMDAVAAYVAQAHGRTLVHVDPFDPTARGPSGRSAIDLARSLAGDGVGLVYWYGYDRPDRRAWALDAVAPQGATARSLWCGDVMVAGADQASGGDLGVATTPGTGSGLVCANLDDEALDACTRLGKALARAYRGSTLPNGEPGGLAFTTVWR